MQYTVHLDAARIDIASVERELQAIDPAGIADLDTLHRTLRISASLSDRDIATLLTRIGLPDDPARIRREPSTCCGGCGG